MQVEIIKNEEHYLEITIDVDRSLLGWLVEKLNQDKGVEFVAYKRDHPNTTKPQLILRTKSKDASDLLLATLEEAEEDVKKFSKAFADITKGK